MTQSSVLRIWSAVQTENLHLRGGKSSNAPDGLVTAILCSAASADMLIAFSKGQQREGAVPDCLRGLCPEKLSGWSWACFFVSQAFGPEWDMKVSQAIRESQWHTPPSCELSCPMAGPRVMIFTHPSMWWSGKCPRLTVSRTERASCSPTMQ